MSGGFFIRTDRPVWPIAIGVVVVVVLSFIGLLDGTLGFAIGLLLGLGILIFWIWESFWRKPR